MGDAVLDDGGVGGTRKGVKIGDESYEQSAVSCFLRLASTINGSWSSSSPFMVGEVLGVHCICGRSAAEE